jgi:hypothetical protein
VNWFPMIVSGTVTLKMAPVVKRIYDQLPDSKWVIPMGACSSVGGPHPLVVRVKKMARSTVGCSVPLDPLGNPFKLMPDGSVEVSDPNDLPFITRGTPRGYVAPPPKFLPSDTGS